MQTKLILWVVLSLSTCLAAQGRSGRHWQPGAGATKMQRLVADAEASRKTAKAVDATSPKATPRPAPETARRAPEGRSGRHWR